MAELEKFARPVRPAPSGGTTDRGMTASRARRGPACPERPPAWWLLLVGIELALAALRDRPPPAGPHIDAAEPSAVDPRSAPARELRRLPGIGRSRAEAIVRARWERGGLPPLTEIDGIGERTAERIESLGPGRVPSVPLQAPDAPRRAAGPPPSGE